MSLIRPDSSAVRAPPSNALESGATRPRSVAPLRFALAVQRGRSAAFTSGVVIAEEVYFRYE